MSEGGLTVLRASKAKKAAGKQAGDVRTRAPHPEAPFAVRQWASKDAHWPRRLALRHARLALLGAFGALRPETSPQRIDIIESAPGNHMLLELSSHDIREGAAHRGLPAALLRQACVPGERNWAESKIYLRYCGIASRSPASSFADFVLERRSLARQDLDRARRPPQAALDPAAIFLLGFARNPLKSPESDEEIQENPRLFPWFFLVWLGLALVRLEEIWPEAMPA